MIPLQLCLNLKRPQGLWANAASLAAFQQLGVLESESSVSVGSEQQEVMRCDNEEVANMQNGDREVDWVARPRVM